MFVSVMAPCITCGTIISCNPKRVPSIRVDGKREPVCRTCIERINPQRIEKGLEPFTIHPDAYSPEDENEVNWQ